MSQQCLRVPPPFEATGTGNQTLTLTPAPIDLSIVAHPSSDFSVTGGTIAYAGGERQYIVTAGITARQPSSNARSTAYHAIYHNGAEVERSRRYTYHRLQADGEQSASPKAILTLQSGDTIQVRSAATRTGDTVAVMRNYSNLIIEAA